MFNKITQLQYQQNDNILVNYEEDKNHNWFLKTNIILDKEILEKIFT